MPTVTLQLLEMIMTTRSLWCLTALVLGVGLARADSETHRVYLTGLVGSGLRVRMDLDLSSARGWYFYEDRKSSL